MRNSAIVVALYFLIFCTLSVESQTTCNVNVTVAQNNCLIDTGCSWTDLTIWTCANYPNGLTVDVNMLGPGNYQINANSADITAIAMRSFTLGAGDAANFTNQVLSSSGVSFQLPQAANINAGGIWNADLLDGTFNGRLNINNGGQFNFLSGSFISSTLPINIYSGGTFSVSSSGSHSIGQSVQNYGNINIVATPLVLSNRAVLSNYGVLELSQGSSISSNTGAENIVSSGVFRISALTISSPSSIDAKITSTGLLDIAPGASGIITSADSSIDNLTISDSSSFTFNANNLNVKNVINSGEITSSSGDMNIRSSGIFLNAGKWSITSGININSQDTGAVRNRGSIFTSGSDLISFGAPFFLLTNGTLVPGGGPLYFKSLNLAGGKIDGPGDITVRTFTWDNGEIHGSGTLEVTLSATISGTSNKLLENKKLLFSGSLSSQISSSITGTGDITVGPTGVVNFGQATVSVPVVNNGRVTGVATINGGFTNNGSLGADGFSATSNAIKLQVNGDLTLSPSSIINVDLFSDTIDSGYVRCRQIATLDGQLIIRAREGLYGSSGTLTIVSATTIVGNFSSIVLDSSQWPNPNKCTISSSFSQASGVKVTFSGCAGSGPAPTPKPASTKLRTFAIVFVVIVLVIVAVGLIAKCQKKCRKRPWDRLTDDRY